MRYLNPFLNYFIFLWLPLGCVSPFASDPVFPDDQVPAIINATDFDRIWENLDGYKGMTLKLAGRIVDTNATQSGVIILAAWLPYVSHFDLEDGPPDTEIEHPRHFAFLFPGIAGDPFAKGPDYDPQVAWKGNKFVLEGTVKGSRTMVLNVLGHQKTMLFVSARCIHVWETGNTEASDQPDSQWPGHIARTFCFQGNQ